MRADLKNFWACLVECHFFYEMFFSTKQKVKGKERELRKKSEKHLFFLNAFWGERTVGKRVKGKEVKIRIFHKNGQNRNNFFKVSHWFCFGLLVFFVFIFKFTSFFFIFFLSFFFSQSALRGEGRFCFFFLLFFFSD